MVHEVRSIRHLIPEGDWGPARSSFFLIRQFTFNVWGPGSTSGVILHQIRAPGGKLYG